MSLLKLLLALFLVFLSGPAFAKPPATQKSLGTFGHWFTYRFTEAGQPVCYMALPYPAAKSAKIKRGDGRLTITERPSENSKDVVSYSAGYIFKTGTSVTASIGKQSFDLFTVKDEAWTRDTSSDRKLTEAIQHGSLLTISGVSSQKGFPTLKDTLDLTGASKAYAAIAKACGMEFEPPAAPTAKTKKTSPHPK